MRIVIPGDPIVKKRPKFTTQGGFARAYDSQDKEKQAAKRSLSIVLDGMQIGHELFQDFHSLPLKVKVEYHIPVSSSKTPSQRNQRLWGLVWSSSRDIDNFLKWSLDIANGILWHDDRQIVELHAQQRYSENPCTILTVEAIKMRLNDDGDKFTRIFSPSAQEKLESDLAILCMALESLRLCQGEDRATHIEAAAGALKAFANDYGLALKKMIAKG